MRLFSHRPSDQSNQRPRDERATADRYASNEVAAVHYVVKQRHHPLLGGRRGRTGHAVPRLREPHQLPSRP